MAMRTPIRVEHLPAPPRFVRPKRIHPRRYLPLIREGIERGVHSVTPPVVYHRALTVAPAEAAGTDELALVTNTELTSPAQQQTASNVGEPSVAMNGHVVFYTGNWYAAVSVDAGQTFRYIDPAAAFRPFDPPNSEFCCDQVVHYVKSIDTFVWLLQYGPDTGDNLQRLAFATTANVAQGRWHLFDVTTGALGVDAAFLDFPDLADDAHHLYMTTNVFFADGDVGSAVVRIPLSGIPSGDVVEQHFVSKDFQSFRVAQNGASTAYFAAHRDTSTLEVFAWDAGTAAPRGQSVAVARWIGGNGYRSRTPNNGRWLDRADPRITGATRAGNELWFAWSVDSGSNHRPRPFVQVARIDATSMKLLENINVFDPDSATCYAALSTNSNDEVGISYMIGGGQKYPSHVVGILTRPRRDLIVAVGERAPQRDADGKGQWGDYLSVRRVFPDDKLFAATGYTLKGAATGSNRDSTPRFVVFGRARDVAAAPTPTPGGGDVAGTGTTEAPVRDVDTLPAVSAAVAAEIKGVAGVFGFVRAAPAAVTVPEPMRVTRPGVERWPVKTGTDADVAKVGKNVIGGRALGAGVVETTVEELISIPRPADMRDVEGNFPAYQNHRADPTELTIWRIEAEIIALKLEGDGDYHLVLQGASGETMIGEIPTPRSPFVLDSSPWLANIRAARRAVDHRLVRHLAPEAFVPMGKSLVPAGALSVQPDSMPEVAAALANPDAALEMGQPLFRTRITPTRARITGVGFFDRVHGQMGVAQSNGIELHPILKVEWR